MSTCARPRFQLWVIEGYDSCVDESELSPEPSTFIYTMMVWPNGNPKFQQLVLIDGPSSRQPYPYEVKLRQTGIALAKPRANSFGQSAPIESVFSLDFITEHVLTYACKRWTIQEVECLYCVTSLLYVRFRVVYY